MTRGVVVMYLDFRPSDPGLIPGVDDNMNKILNLRDHESPSTAAQRLSPIHVSWQWAP